MVPESTSAAPISDQAASKCIEAARQSERASTGGFSPLAAFDNRQSRWRPPLCCFSPKFAANFKAPASTRAIRRANVHSM